MSPRPRLAALRPARRPSLRPELRIGDADRERAATGLADHYTVGRLDKDEHNERLDQIWAARTRAELTRSSGTCRGRAARTPPARGCRRRPRPGGGTAAAGGAAFRGRCWCCWSCSGGSRCSPTCP